MRKYAHKSVFYCKRLQCWKGLWIFRYGVEKGMGRFLLGGGGFVAHRVKIVVLVVVLDVSFEIVWLCIQSSRFCS